MLIYSNREGICYIIATYEGRPRALQKGYDKSPPLHLATIISFKEQHIFVWVFYISIEAAL